MWGVASADGAGRRELVPKPAGRRYTVRVREVRMVLAAGTSVSVSVYGAPAEAEVASRASGASARGMSASYLPSSRRDRHVVLVLLPLAPQVRYP